ncbi:MULTISPECIES: AAA family ATPase [Eisenbergiella]|uniref:AAA family ATPase n=1 Tax=Eisenbergiella TaxID=1432051 RepID=UPI0023F120A8|nr:MULTISPECIES: AAA family ATPase [Eisenbergiella]MCI6708529.1 AAA family ATPase [Eisenbergiella massiliensis]MDY5529317.1 AAA family ATPase [Eisenbergiella porci]
MTDGFDIIEILEHIDPSRLNYQEWVNVGMALKEEGHTAADWDAWSRRDAGRYHPGECFRKWDTFRGTLQPVTGGTIVQMAKDQGWQPETGHELDWDDTISDERVVVDKNWIEGREVEEPETWDPTAQLIKYLETLFESSENVGYVTASWEKDGKHLPTQGNWDRTAGQLIEQLSKCGGDIGSVLGDYKPEAGAWIRFNPLDGKGCKNENVTEYRYALVESDATDLAKQNAIIREMELPVACLVHSGKKSIHAIVRVDAANYDEYRKRVNYLYEVCKKNGLEIDTQNRNPSRLSRMPGVMRNGRKQFLIDTNIGKSSWNEWYEWIESVNDDLPDPESLQGVWDNLPELAPCLIDGVLRQGHKMLIAGPSKAGKSFLLIEMCIAIAEGRPWLGWGCAKGRVMYVNLELDAASCLHRFRDVYGALGWEPRNLKNIDIWNLRGKSVPMDRLAPKLIRRAAKKDYIAIIIDPIYKVITGDENSADQMAAFCNQFDKICTELGTAVIYCHHHSKGAQGGKRSMDRASGSGVFARDPDALLDLIELDVTPELMTQQESAMVCDTCIRYLNNLFEDWEDDVSQDDMLSYVQMLAYCKKKLSAGQYSTLNALIDVAVKKAKALTAWRIDGTLREFPKFAPVNLWFDYPIHRSDKSGVLNDIQPDAEKAPWQRGKEARKKQGEQQRKMKVSKYNMAIENFRFEHNDQYPTIKELFELMKSDAEAVGEKYPAEKTVRNSLRELGYDLEKGTGRICPTP